MTHDEARLLCQLAEKRSCEPLQQNWEHRPGGAARGPRVTLPDPIMDAHQWWSGEQAERWEKFLEAFNDWIFCDCCKEDRECPVLI